jgi:PucR C-terminal helix-turn-helix domain
MQNLARLRAESRPRWHALLTALGQREAQWLEALMSTVDGGGRYYGGLVEPQDFKGTSARVFRYLLGQLSTGAPPAELAGLPEEIGRTRARQRVPLESLTTTIRQDFGVFWSTLLWIAGAADMPVLLCHVDDLWRAVDDFAGEVQISHLRESASLAAQDRDRQRSMTSVLFSSDTHHPDLIRQVAGALAIPVDGPYQVIACPPAAVPVRPGVLTHESDGALVVFWPGAQPPDVGLRCGHAPDADGLAAVPAMARTARHILRALPPGHDGPATMRDVWDRIAAEQMRHTAPDFLGVPLARLASVPAQERARIVETARSYLATGSVATTASALYCHRNTVMTRMRRFRELTGLDLTIPREAALATVLLASEGHSS